MNLDKEQLEVVAHRNGSCLVIAGAGAGKTTTIIAYADARIREGAEASKALMITFTKKAGGEMRDRMDKLMEGSGVSREGMFIGTQHAFGYSLIREDWAGYGFMNMPTMLDDKESIAIVKPLLKNNVGKWSNISATLETMWNSIEADMVLDVYSLFRDDGYSITQGNAGVILDNLWKENDRLPDLDGDMILDILTIIRGYEKYKNDTCCVDFDDMIRLPVDRMSKDENYRQMLGARYTWLMVDETQDTSRSQYAMIKLIGSVNNQVLMVGDDDQSIYSWRGARKENMDMFLKDFNATIYRLQTNYRSKGDIVENAGAHIANNQNRFGNKPRASRAAGNDIHFFVHPNSYEASKQIVTQVKRSIARGRNPKSISVLYRTNQMSKSLSMECARQGVEFNVVGDTDLRSRKEVKLMVAVARLLMDNPRDVSAFRTIAEYLKDIGTTAINAIEKDVLENKAMVLNAVKYLKEKPQASLDNFREKVNALCQDGLFGLVNWILDPAGMDMRDYWMKKEPNDYRKRLDTLDMMDHIIQKDLIDSDDPMGDFFRIFLDSSFQDEEDPKKITLSTIHRAKGLEWEEVHIYGFSDMVMPFGVSHKDVVRKNLDRGDAGKLSIAEERNLSYVAMTRAKDKVVFHHAKEYIRFGESSGQVGPSMFLKELPCFKHLFDKK